MTGAIILNGISKKKKKFFTEILPPVASRFNVGVFETQYKGHAIELAANAVKQNVDFILAAGGDGTLNQVLNGMLRDNVSAALPPLGLLPLGTGNDFARACNAKADPRQIIQLLKLADPKPTDVGQLVCHDNEGAEMTRYFINCCSLGMGPDVVHRLETADRKYGATHTYIKAIVKTFFTQHPPVIRCQSKDWVFEGKVRVLGIANGKSFGRAVYLAPDALLDDGMLNAFVALDVPTLRFLIYLHLLKAKLKLRNSSVLYRTISTISISSNELCALETEGELAGFLPAKIDILPGRINFFR